MLKLDLAAGAHPTAGYTPVDRVAVNAETLVFDLVSGERWPWQDCTVDALVCRHFVEHIPAEEKLVWKSHLENGMPMGKYVQQDLLFWFFDEAYRICKPGAELKLVWPALKSTDAFRDPTHRRFLPLEFLHYLSREGRHVMGLDHYVAQCNWVTEGAECQVEPLTTDQDPWTDRDRDRLWDVQRAFSVTLTAVKG